MAWEVAMNELVRRLLMLLAMAAVGCVPVEGLSRGWLCECSGIVRAACCVHCHDEGDCHDHEHDEHEHGDENDDGDEHDEEVAPLIGETALVVMELPATVWTAVWQPWLVEVSGEREVSLMEVLPRGPPDPGGGCGMAHVIARSVSLRI
jgi:hypothetical protein